MSYFKVSIKAPEDQLQKTKSQTSSVGEETRPDETDPSDILVVPNELFVENRKKFLTEIKKKKSNSIIFLQGRREKFWYNTYKALTFRQESFFLWLFGVTEPGFYGALDIESGKTYLFTPILDNGCAICEEMLSPEIIKKKYAVDFVYPVKDIDVQLAILCRNDLLVLQYVDKNDILFPRPDIPTLECFKLDLYTLWPILVDCRMIKSRKEMDLIRYICHITNEGHRYVMKNISPGMFAFQAKSLFVFYIQYVAFCKQIVKSPRITAVSRIRQSTQVSNIDLDEILNAGEMVYFEIGACYHGYSVNLVSTFPVNGYFSDLQKEVHEVVFKIREYVLKKVKPNTTVTELRQIAKKSLIKLLLLLEVVLGSVEQMIAECVADHFELEPFFNMVGIDVEDVGKDLLEPKLCSTEGGKTTTGKEPRTLEPGMTIALYYSCYFLPEKLRHETIMKYATNKIDKYLGQGTSLQDILCITDNGFEILSWHPKSVQEIEGLRDKTDFRKRKGKDLDIIEGRKLFPVASEVVEEEIQKIRKAYNDDNIK